MLQEQPTCLLDASKRKTSNSFQKKSGRSVIVAFRFFNNILQLACWFMPLVICTIPHPQGSILPSESQTVPSYRGFKYYPQFSAAANIGLFWNWGQCLPVIKLIFRLCQLHSFFAVCCRRNQRKAVIDRDSVNPRLKGSVPCLFLQGKCPPDAVLSRADAESFPRLCGRTQGDRQSRSCADRFGRFCR